MEMYALPPGSTTAPLGHPFMHAVMGASGSAGGNYDYTLSNTVCPSVSMTVTDALSEAQEKMSGMLVEEMKVSFGSEEPKLSFSGVASEYMRAVSGGATVSSGATNATQTLQSSEAYQFDAGTILSLGSNDDARVASRAVGSDTITLAASITTITSDAVTPYTPWTDSSSTVAAMAGQPIASYDNALTIGGTTFVPLSGEISIKRNWKEFRPAGSQTFTDASPGHREVTGKLTFAGRTSDLVLLSRSQANPATDTTVQALAVVLTLGNTTDGRLVITLAKCVFDWAKLTVPEADQATFELPFTALTTLSSGVPQNDEIVLSWD